LLPFFEADGGQRGQRDRSPCRRFLRHNTYRPVELIVADDGSSPAEQQAIRDIGFDVYILSPRNRGLGANNNAGLRAAKGKYILMMQDDWKMTPAASGKIEQAIDILEADNTVGMIRFCGDPEPFPLTKGLLIRYRILP
jgi:GT2 family glycosyltransferase